MWLVSARTALSILGAMAGTVALAALTGLSPGLTLLLGAPAGALIASALLGAAADRLDRSLHRMGGPRLRRRR